MNHLWVSAYTEEKFSRCIRNMLKTILKKLYSYNLFYMKTKGEKVTYQWLSYNHQNFHCTRFPIFRWTEPCCSTYDEQTDRVELTTALGELALSYIRTRTTARWISDSRMLDFRWHYWIGLLGVLCQNRQKYPTRTF